VSEVGFIVLALALAFVAVAIFHLVLRYYIKGTWGKRRK
jgi:NADH:ubiquinone oxidoreductase subunit 5 (subunit L)/multisubunit Na+/H+ antiporter MnhA subunit